MVSQRIQRWALTLSMYAYSVKYRPGKAHCNADALSQLSLPDCPESTPVPAEVVLSLHQLQFLRFVLGHAETHCCQRSTVMLSLVGQQVFQLNYNLTLSKEMNVLN